MNQNHSAITRLTYQLFIALGKKSVSKNLAMRNLFNYIYFSSKYYINFKKYYDLFNNYIFKIYLLIIK